MSPTISDEGMKSNEIYNSEIFDKPINFKNLHIESFVSEMLNKVQSNSIPKLNDYSIYKSLHYKIESLNLKIRNLSRKLIFKKSQEIAQSMDAFKHSSEYQHFLNSIKKYIIEDEDTESSSDDCHSYMDYSNSGFNSEASVKTLNKYQTWLVERCQYQSRWSWLLSEIQSTEFRLKHLKKYSEEIKHVKRKYCSKNDWNNEENSRNRYSRLEKRKRTQIHNLLSADLIKFVSPLYSGDDNWSDKFVQCKCRLGDTGPCILCCGMKNKFSELQTDIEDKKDILKASILDNYIHIKLSRIDEVRNQMKRNVLFNGYVKNSGPHWSYPRTRTSISPIISTPSQPKIDNINKTCSVYLEFNGINLDKKETDINLTNDYCNKYLNIRNEKLNEHPNNAKIEIKLPLWKKIDSPIRPSGESQINVQSEYITSKVNNKSSITEDLSDDLYIRRHELEESLERCRNYPLNKVTNIQTDSVEIKHFHGYEYKQSSDLSYDVRLFPLISDEFKQLSYLSKNNFHRSKRFKKRITKF